MYFLSSGNGTPIVTCKSAARLLYISTFIHVFRNKLCMKVGDCLYYHCFVTVFVVIVFIIIITITTTTITFFEKDLLLEYRFLPKVNLPVISLEFCTVGMFITVDL